MSCFQDLAMSEISGQFMASHELYARLGSRVQPGLVFTRPLQKGYDARLSQFRVDVKLGIVYTVNEPKLSQEHSPKI